MKILDYLNKNKRFMEFASIIKKDTYNLFAYNCVFSANIYLTYKLFLESNDTIFYICSNIYKATIAYEAFVSIAGIDNVNYYVMDDFSSSEVLATSSEYKFERMYTIDALIKGKKRIIVCNVASILRLINPKVDIEKHIIRLNNGDNVNISNLINILYESGYKRVASVEVVGEFSIRGEVIDIYPINLDHPVRIDFFDNEIEYIKTFDPTTQKTIEKIKDVDILPISEIYYDDANIVINNIYKDAKSIETQNFLKLELDDFQNYDYSLKMLKYIKYCTKTPTRIIDYSLNKVLVFEEYSNILEVEDKINKEAIDFLPVEVVKELNLNLFMPLSNIINDSNKSIYLSEFKQSMNNIYLSDILDISSSSLIDYKGNINLLAQEIKNRKNTTIIGYIDDKRKNLIKDVLEANDISINIDSIKENKVNIINCSDYLSLEIDNDLYISEQTIFKKNYEKLAKYRSSFKDIIPINSKEDIEVGEFVVHYDYGIARYKGIKEVNLNGICNDYLVLAFANMDLLLPVEKISVIDKYQASEGVVPRLSRIGTKDWAKKKEAVREKLASLASSLIKIQAIRDSSAGFKYNQDEADQQNFESDFTYEETPDQLKAINDIKQDMEQGKIVDRLVCGDVGYGKTEVAMRIAFKTVMNGKQVAYLAPTTILTRQHYYLFKERFEKYGINVALINRFVSDKEVGEIIKGLYQGSIDIVIGTHALLNDKIRYKNLGLLIVDEEQRFGVEHKEKIKQYKSLINVITLTATPIPRTLQMSLMGARQLSLIETPPKNRYPIKTYVLEYNDIVIREAIYNELARGGQVFYLYNRVSTLDRVASHLKKLVPEARIATAHGQMPKEQLEDIIQSFIDKEYDVLLCTTIIETGIDIPNTNTLIVQMADRLGLSQMYQIRGRVGRSDRLAYAYFVYDQGKVLTDNSKKRLNAIKEFTNLGSGYKIALRDLAIRGAGDILGKEQSGFIDDIGLDLYMKLLAEEMDKLNGIKKEEPKLVSNTIEVSKHVDKTYVSDDEIRIYIHKRIDSINSLKEKNELIEELEDRFGKLSEELLLYIDKKYLDILIAKCDIEKVKDLVSIIEITFTQEYSANINAASLFSIAYKLSSKFSFEYKNKKIFVKYIKQGTKRDWINMISRFLEGVASLKS